MNRKGNEGNTKQAEVKSRLKAMLITNAALKKWKKQADASKNRYMRILELINTEKDYYNDLSILNFRVKMPLIENKIISQNQGKHMFYNLQSMMELSLQIKRGLLLMLQSWNSRTTKVGEYMAVYAQFLLVYSEYFKNLNDTQKRMKELLQINPKVRQIEKSLSTSNKLVTIQNLIAKPFQRPLKYHLILKDYFKKLHESHPDYQSLKRAIMSYHKVNQQNNMLIENSQKQHILAELDAKYSNILSQPRSYVSQYHALYISMPVTLFIFSDLVIVINRNTQEVKCRVYLDKFSLITFPKDEIKYRNGFYLYGASSCVFLRFESESQRDIVHFELRDLLETINQNELARQNLLSIRVDSPSVKQNSIFPSVEPQFVRPLICTVVGYEKRSISKQVIKQFYVIEFRAHSQQKDAKMPPLQLSLLSWETLLKIQGFVRLHNEKELTILPLSFIPKDLNAQKLNLNEAVRYQLSAILIQMLFNSLFRSRIILARIDVICKQLNICDALWRHLGTYSQLCFCQFCVFGTNLDSFEKYENQRKARVSLKQSQNKGVGASQFCETRTINSQMMISQLQLEQVRKITTSEDRIYWIKARRGFIDHSLTNIRPSSPFTERINLRVYLHTLKGKEYIDVQVLSSSRVKHIIDQLSKIFKFDLSDYALELQMGEEKYILNEDELIENIYIEYHEHKRAISKFFAIFKEDDYLQTYYLKKVWVLQSDRQLACCNQKLLLQAEEIVCRIYSWEIRLSSQQVYSVIAAYFAFLHFQELDVMNIKLKREELSSIVPQYYKQKNCYAIIQEKFKYFQRIKTLKKENLVKHIISVVMGKPGWSCIMFSALEGVNEVTKKVKIGCDLKGVHVSNDDAKAISKYEFRHQQGQWSHKLIGQCLVINCSQREYWFTGRSLWVVNQQIQFFQIYYQTFMKRC